MPQAPRILIVEDQYFVAVDCELQLRSAGCEVIGLAASAGEAIELAERERPDLVIMDVHLASLADGIDTAILMYERLGIRCVFASAHADAAGRAKAQRADPLAWLDKPYTGEELVRTVQRSLAVVRAAASSRSDAEAPVQLAH